MSIEGNNQMIFRVEYKLSGVVFYRNVNANSMEEAKLQIKSGQPDAEIRAVSIVENEEKHGIN